MNIDDAVKKAFALELEACPKREPDAAEVARACSQLRANRAATGSLRIGDLVPLLAMAAVAIFAFVLDPVYMTTLRPLASELVIAAPADAGSRFMDFVLEAGESYRSID